MKRGVITMCIILLCTGFVSGKSPNLSVKVGGLNSTTQILFGSRTLGGRSVIPTLGLGYFSVSSSIENGDKSEVSVRLLIPRIGARIISSTLDNLRSYLSVGVFTIIPMVSGTDLSKDDEEDAKDFLDLFGITVGWGIEYFFSDQFSVGGETSLNWNYHNIDFEGSTSKATTTFASSLAQVTFNFYFR